MNRLNRQTRRVAVLTLILVGVFGVAAASSAGATTFGGGGYADTKSTCGIPGLVGYQGAGFTYARFSSYVYGEGWRPGAWQSFRRNWNESMVLTLAPVPERGKSFAILAEYIYVNPVDHSTTTAREWVPMDGAGYWCTIR